MTNPCCICGHRNNSNMSLTSGSGNEYYVCDRCINFRFTGVDGNEIEEAERQMAKENFESLYKTFQYRRGHINKRDARGQTDIMDNPYGRTGGSFRSNNRRN